MQQAQQPRTTKSFIPCMMTGKRCCVTLSCNTWHPNDDCRLIYQHYSLQAVSAKHKARPPSRTPEEASHAIVKDTHEQCCAAAANAPLQLACVLPLVCTSDNSTQATISPHSKVEGDGGGFLWICEQRQRPQLHTRSWHTNLATSLCC